MREKIDVLVIGTDPPCPRCDLLGVRVKEAASPHLVIELKHCAFNSPQAEEIGRRLGCKIGTAKHVAKDADIPMDWGAVYGIITQRQLTLDADSRPADAWSPELDDALSPCQLAAESVGYLMTPILLINGQVVHHGSVPSCEMIASWISQ